ncbi:MAG: zinc ribbon domain-containing protein [Clostridiales bacterium]|nr:zinc ribbon domain-containing protein [Clostridiales bacterium]
MKCKKCGHELPTGSQFCGNCGKKIKKKATIKTVLWALLTIAGFLLVTAALAYFLASNNVFSVLQGFFYPATEAAETVVEPAIATPPAPTEALVLETPEFVETEEIKTGFGYTEYYDSEKLIYIGQSTKNILVNPDYSDVTGRSIAASTKKAKQFFYQGNYIYAITENEIIKIDYLNGGEETILHTDKADSFYVGQEFIFYTKPKPGGTYDLYRININGGSPILIAGNIFNFGIDQKTESVFYSAIVEASARDSKNNYLKFIELESTSGQANKYLTIYNCDLAGESVYKFAEKPVDSTYNVFNTQFYFLDGKTLFTIEYYGTKELCIAENDRGSYILLGAGPDKLENYFIYDENIYYTQAGADNPYLLGLYEYNYIAGNSRKITETTPYTSLSIFGRDAYIVVDNSYVLKCGLAGGDLTGYFDFSGEGKALGPAIGFDKENIYFKNAILKQDRSQLIYNGLNQITHYNYDSPREYINNPNYLELLSTPDNLGKNKLFALQDIDSDNAPELFVAEKNLEPVTPGALYQTLLNTKIYTFNETELDSQNNFVNATRFLFNRFDGELLAYSYGTGLLISYVSVESGKIVSKPYLSQENGKYYLYENNNNSEITYDEFLLEQGETENSGYFSDLRLSDINISNIIKNLYFVNI